MKQQLIVFVIILISLNACAQQSESAVKAQNPENVNYTTELVVSDINIPWGMAFLPDGSMLITEKAGELIHFKNGTKTLVEGVPEIYVRGQGGFMDVKLHPNYETNGWIYFSYASAEGEGDGGNTAIMRAKLKDNTLVEKEVLYKASPNSKKGQHFGSRIEFDNDGYLYFSIGERGERDINPQDITRDCGKIYRLHDDGRIPKDNPFVNSENAKPAIYSYGHRNPQGLIKNPETGDLWEHEHGPQGGDEINIIRKGKNYGWPVISYGINYNGTPFTDITEKEGMEQPLFYWTPSIAPSGMAFVTSNKYPDWKGSILVGSLKFGYLERLVLNKEKVVKREKLLDKIGRVRDVIQAPDGYIYVAVEGKGIVKIVPKN
ncbi:Soluble aldose sugar dehydrogenase YliI precursor [Mariniflexile rhizosphaerae]|uniref:PQQ-dependent sugar dehydrogenase n=1 Tax=unclassified Mariniflexile TaxID=2643887 RepID=UPI000CB4CADE|nr:PQQ-dependent sugar dehydrogenase [Mariniflexile sp. TRM1-10]AXP81442.1 Soluble aldose sugar dehydrogenase YliI precursor [Mariniflexile sp. TRM1-10]PLB18346.1 MAG: Glucose/sorbosone dehydrogenase [Flavobacteriaceae bacterium FS1-H7996/R]